MEEKVTPKETVPTVRTVTGRNVEKNIVSLQKINDGKVRINLLADEDPKDVDREIRQIFQSSGIQARYVLFQDGKPIPFIISGSVSPRKRAAPLTDDEIVAMINDLPENSSPGNISSGVGTAPVAAAATVPQADAIPLPSPAETPPGRNTITKQKPPEVPTATKAGQILNEYTHRKRT